MVEITIQVDSREKARAIKQILAVFKQRGVDIVPHSLPYGDYMSFDNPRLVIDRKQNLSELCGNVSDVPMKDDKGRTKRYADGRVMTPRVRFLEELSGAQRHGIKLIILCEHGRNITCLNDIINWKNPRLKQSPLAVSGERLYKILYALGNTYNVDFVFCTKAQTGAKIIELLQNGTTEI